MKKMFHKVLIFCWYFSRSFQWCTPKSAIGNGFGEKYEKLHSFVFSTKMRFFAPKISPLNDGKWLFGIGG